MSNQFRIRNCNIEGLKIIKPFYVEDERGYFLKNYEKDIFYEMGIKDVINEEFETFSKKNVIRGLHFQLKNSQIKMVRVIRGKIMDVVVDIRKNSPTFGQYEIIELSEENRLIFYIPAGFAHGFRVLSENAVVSYRCIGKYDRETDTGIKWNDNDLQINWGNEKEMYIVSQRDMNLMTFKEFQEKYQGI